eukprot:2923602-Prymnesium_polylepis.1
MGHCIIIAPTDCTGRLRGVGGAALAAVICHASSPSRSVSLPCKMCVTTHSRHPPFDCGVHFE